MAVEPIDLFDINKRRACALSDGVLILVVLRDDRCVVPVGGEGLRPVVHNRSQVVRQSHSVDLEVAALREVAFRSACYVLLVQTDVLVAIVAGLLVPET